MPIVRLDKNTIEQIAAGEVIESPVSIVKELFENSVDAKASNVTVEIKNGGKTYIRVTDDGIGIEKDEMFLAFEKHATSKIKKFDDLYDIYSLGFRGEALSSIVSVSDVDAISKTSTDDIGSKISFTSGVSSQSKIATNTGTSIEVRNLFTNLPVRKKFLRSDISETNAITKLMYSLAIGYRDISIKYIKDGRVEFITNANENLKYRIVKLLDDNLDENLIHIDARNDLYQIEGYISNSNYYRGSRSYEYIYVNNRLIDSPVIVEAIESRYRSIIPQGRFPAIFIFIKTNPKNLDVNIHPNKRTIKFNYEDELIELIETTIKDALSKNLAPDTINIKDNKEELIADFSDYQGLLNKYSKITSVREPNSTYEKDYFFDTKNEIKLPDAAPNKDIPTVNESFIESKSNFKYLTNFFGRYALFQNTSDKISILDLRRADQAIKFDRFIKELENGSITSQMLIDPIIINLKASDKIKYNEKRELIKSIGLDVDDFGDDKIIIRSIPQILDLPSDDSFFYDLLDLKLTNQTDIFYKQISKYITQTSFRKGYKIGEAEAISYIEDIFKLDNPYKSYDGKAIIVEIDKDELEKYFDR